MTNRDTTRGILLRGLLYAAIGVAIPLVVIRCASLQPRHVATGASTAVKDALIGLQQTADVAEQVGTITHAQRQAIAQHLAPALQVGQDVNRVILDWVPGQPVPANLAALIANLSALLTDVTAQIPDAAVRAKATALVASAQGALLLLLAGR